MSFATRPIALPQQGPGRAPERAGPHVIVIPAWLPQVSKLAVVYAYIALAVVLAFDAVGTLDRNTARLDALDAFCEAPPPEVPACAGLDCAERQAMAVAVSRDWLASYALLCPDGVW